MQLGQPSHFPSSPSSPGCVSLYSRWSTKKKKTIILSNAGVDRVTLTGISRKPRLFLIVTTLACKDVCELMRLFSQQVAQTLFSIEKFKNVSFEEEYTKLFPPQPHQPLV